MLLSPQLHAQSVWTAIDNRNQAAQRPTVTLVAADVEKLHDRLPIVIPQAPQGQTALPMALVNPSRSAHPFGDHTPCLFQDYPFQLVPKALGMDEWGEPALQDTLWIDPSAPHWNTDLRNGYPLFDDEGQPSEALKQVMQRLRALQAEMERTRALVELLNTAGGLSRYRIWHRDQEYHVLKVVMDGLEARLEAIDSPLAMTAAWFADRIAHAQQSLEFLPYPASSFGFRQP